MAKYSKENPTEDVEQRVLSAFKIFDHESDNSIDARDVGAVIRYLGCCPSEADLKVLVEEIQDGQQSGFVNLDNFLPIVTKLVEDNRHPPATYDQLLEACRLLDTDRKGYFTKDEFKQLLASSGEPFSEAEVEELNSTFNVSEDKVAYDEWITCLIEQPAIPTNSTEK